MILLTVSDRVRIWQGLVRFDPVSGVLTDGKERVVANSGDVVSSGNSGQMEAPSSDPK